MLLAASPDLAAQLDELLRQLRSDRVLGAFRPFDVSVARWQEGLHVAERFISPAVG